MEAGFSPGIADFDQSCLAFAQHVRSNDRVNVAGLDTFEVFGHVFWFHILSARNQEVINGVFVRNELPESFFVHVVVSVFQYRVACKSPDCFAWDSCCDMLVVSISLSKSFLNHDGPKWRFFGQFREQSSKALVFLFNSRQIVINDNGHGQAERVKLHSVETAGRLVVVRVQEKLFNAAWGLRNCCQT